MDPCKTRGTDGKYQYSIKHGNWLWEPCEATKVIQPIKLLQGEEAGQWIIITPLEYLLATGINFHSFVTPEKDPHRTVVYFHVDKRSRGSVKFTRLSF